jgi:hypothetical protein
MSDEISVLLKFCEEEWAQRRQSENQRATITNILMTAAVAIVIIIIQNGASRSVIPFAALLIFIGIYGALITAKFYERSEVSMFLVKHWRKRIDELCPESRLLEYSKAALQEHAQNYTILRKVRLYFLWIFLHLSVAIIGCFLLAISLSR